MVYKGTKVGIFDFGSGTFSETLGDMKTRTKNETAILLGKKERVPFRAYTSIIYELDTFRFWKSS